MTTSVADVSPRTARTEYMVARAAARVSAFAWFLGRRIRSRGLTLARLRITAGAVLIGIESTIATVTGTRNAPSPAASGRRFDCA